MIHPVQMLILFLLIIDLIAMIFLLVKRVILKKKNNQAMYPILTSLKIFNVVLSIFFMYWFTMNLDWENWLFMGSKDTIIAAMVITYLVLTLELIVKKKYKYLFMIFIGFLCSIKSLYHWVKNFRISPNNDIHIIMSPEENYLINMIAYGLLFIAGIVGLILKLRKK